VLSEAPRAAPASKFPTRVCDGTYSLLPSDFEDLHEILRGINRCYRRVARECDLIHPGSVSPGNDIQKWRPRLAAIYQGSSTWLRRNDITLASAVAAVRFPQVKIVYSGVSEANDGLDPRIQCRHRSISTHMRFSNSTNAVNWWDILAKFCLCSGLNLPIKS
jgi:hypothetical protein